MRIDRSLRRANPWALAVAALVGVPRASAADLSAREIMEKNLVATKVSAFTADTTIKLSKDGGGERVRALTIRSKLKDNGVDSRVLMRFREPADVRGTGFLQIENSRGDDDIWLFLPALSKSRRLVSSNKKDSFFGTDFAYGDILLPAVERYTHRLLREESVEGRGCYVIESVPAQEKTRDESGYSRKVSWIDRESFVERKVEYYDVGGALFKTQTVQDVRLVEPERGRWIAMRREMINHRTRHRTVYAFERFDVVPALPDAVFSARNLEQER